MYIYITKRITNNETIKTIHTPQTNKTNAHRPNKTKYWHASNNDYKHTEKGQSTNQTRKQQTKHQSNKHDTIKQDKTINTQ